MLSGHIPGLIVPANAPESDASFSSWNVMNSDSHIAGSFGIGTPQNYDSVHCHPSATGSALMTSKSTGLVLESVGTGPFAFASAPAQL